MGAVEQLKVAFITTVAMDKVACVLKEQPEFVGMSDTNLSRAGALTVIAQAARFLGDSQRAESSDAEQLAQLVKEQYEEGRRMQCPTT